MRAGLARIHKMQFIEPFAASPWRHRGLIWVLGWRELSVRYRGALLGLVWAIVTPLLMLAVFTFVFGVVLKARWGGAADDSIGMFALRLLAGLLLHGILAEAVGRAPGLLLQHSSYVTKVVFPLETLSWMAVFVAAFHGVVGIGLLVVVNGFWGTGFALTQLALPLVILPYLLLLVALTLMLSSLGVYLRDLQQIVGSLVMVCMFLGPVLFPRSTMPEQYQGWLLLNPLTVPVEQARLVLFDATWPDWSAVAIYLGCAIALYSIAVMMFSTLRRGFSDVL